MNFEYLYDVKLNYEQGKSDPYIVFSAYAEIVFSFRKIDNLLGKTVTYGCNCVQTLEDVQPGSIISKIKELLEYPETELGGKPAFKQDVMQNYMESGTKVILDSMNQKEIVSEAHVQEITNEIRSIADKNKISDLFTYSAPQTAALVSVIKNFADSIHDLSEHESVVYQASNILLPINSKVEIDIDKLIESLKGQTTQTKSEMILKVKRPDLLGNAKWQCKHGQQTIPLKIIDMEWLDKFHNADKLVVPGDSLKGTVDVIYVYDKSGNLIKADYTLEKVVDIIHGRVD